MPTAKDVTIVFDTDCVLCSSWVHFLLRHERDQHLKFVGAWSKTRGKLAAEHGLSQTDLQETYLVIEDGRGLVKSDAGLALLRQLRAPYRWFEPIAWIIPRTLRDQIYTVVARNRYKWFGRSERCFVPPPDARSRFIDD